MVGEREEGSSSALDVTTILTLSDRVIGDSTRGVAREAVPEAAAFGDGR
jgi:hypothetical protein